MICSSIFACKYFVICFLSAFSPFLAADCLLWLRRAFIGEEGWVHIIIVRWEEEREGWRGRKREQVKRIKRMEGRKEREGWREGEIEQKGED